MDSLPAGKLPLSEGGLAIVMSSVTPLEGIIPRHRENDSGIRAKTVRLPAGIPVRDPPGIPFAFIPDRFSRSPTNRLRLGQEFATLHLTRRLPAVMSAKSRRAKTAAKHATSTGTVGRQAAAPVGMRLKERLVLRRPNFCTP